ncbi:MAG: SH3 domain-containing protein [Spirochaetales bacterium]|nr:SH3 domain-containing protein [Spirochaetales bacterium]
MKRTPSFRRILFPVVVFLALLSSCGMGRIGTGVVVWSDSESLANGSVVWIWDQSSLQKTFTIQKTDGGSRSTIANWRIRFFNNPEEAKTFAAEFAPWKNIWGVTQKPGMAVYQQPNSTSPKVYRLGDNEDVKILGQQAQPSTEGGFTGHWDKVMTSSGYTGWCFDYFLSLYKVANNQKVVLKQGGPEDFYLRTVETNSWYPEEFRFEVAQKRINLNYFRPDYDFHFDGDKTFSLTTPPPLGSTAPAASYSFTFSDVRKINSGTFLFVCPENLMVRILNPEVTKIEVSFTEGSQTHRYLYVRLDQDIGTYISQETASRVDELNAILAYGTKLTSPIYGNMTLASDGSVTWTGFQALQPPQGIAFPQGLANTAHIYFDWFKDSQFAGDWKVFRLQFDPTAQVPEFSQVFLYRFLKGGMQMIPVSPSDLNPVKQTVLRESRIGYTIFMTFEK